MHSAAELPQDNLIESALIQMALIVLFVDSSRPVTHKQEHKPGAGE